jgi:integral membrane protein
MSAPLPSQIPQIRKVLKFYRVSSYVTGVFLLLLMITWGIRRLPFLGFDLWLFGPNGFLTLESYGVEGEGLPTTGLNLTVWILIIHGWLYVVYLIADFRVWTLMRWPVTRFLFIALGGIVPFLSFYTEAKFAKLAEKELQELEK